MAQEEELRKVREEIAKTKREVAILPEEKRIPYETKLAELQRQEVELQQKLYRADLGKLASEVEHLGATLGVETSKLSGLIGRLAAEVRERISAEDVEQVRRMVSEMRTFHEGLLLPWRREISKELEDRVLWADRIARREAELVHRVEGEYAIYESYHHLPSCETWVRTIPKPYV